MEHSRDEGKDIASLFVQSESYQNAYEKPSAKPNERGTHHDLDT